MNVLTTAPPLAPADIVTPLLRRARVPERFLGRRLGTFQPRPGVQRAHGAAVAVAVYPPRAGLALVGQVGTGKTHLAVGVLAEVADQWLKRYPQQVSYEGERATVRPGLVLRFAVVPSLLDELRAGMAYGDRPDPLLELRSADLVVLDDLGRERMTDFAAERLYVLVNDRYNARLPTIVTSNSTPAQLAEQGYDAVLSRLAEDGRVIHIQATDYRRETHS